MKLMRYGEEITMIMRKVNEKVISTPLKPEDVKRVRGIIDKTKTARTLNEIHQYNSELKKIDAKNRRKAIVGKILSEYKTGVPND